MCVCARPVRSSVHNGRFKIFKSLLSQSDNLLYLAVPDFEP